MFNASTVVYETKRGQSEYDARAFGPAPTRLETAVTAGRTIYATWTLGELARLSGYTCFAHNGVVYAMHRDPSQAQELKLW